ncbi:GNAT family N-acetyltransferase [Actinacidiphila glaucinigra]|uniref:GNAT family N-acetyltransferase n=1 Tax=Actinacidiphila glaucinigra TaxID=235986 RepID=UPI0033B45B55
MDFTAGGRLEVRITPSDVGKRVSVRRVAEIVEGRPVFADAVGILTSWDEGVLVVTRRDGETVRIAESALVAGKIVPDAPARRGARAPRATARELQESASRCWPAQETARLGAWTLRAAGGFTRRANSVLPLGDPGVPLTEAVARIARWYGDRGLPPYVQVTTGGQDSDETLAEALGGLGWTAEGHALLRTAALAPIADLPGAEAVHLSREADAEWLARYHRTGDLGDAALRVLGGGPSVWFATVPGEGDTAGAGPAAIGRCAVDGRFASFGAVEVSPDHRRRGLARAVMAALARKALDEGASGAYLQVETDNEGARALYDRMGFTTHHAYHYRRGPLPAGG